LLSKLKTENSNKASFKNRWGPSNGRSGVSGSIRFSAGAEMGKCSPYGFVFNEDLLCTHNAYNAVGDAAIEAKCNDYVDQVVILGKSTVITE
jgi:hypothetical protein